MEIARRDAIVRGMILAGGAVLSSRAEAAPAASSLAEQFAVRQLPSIGEWAISPASSRN